MGKFMRGERILFRRRVSKQTVTSGKKKMSFLKKMMLIIGSVFGLFMLLSIIIAILIGTGVIPEPVTETAKTTEEKKEESKQLTPPKNEVKKEVIPQPPKEIKAYTQYIVHQKCGKEAFEIDKWKDYGYIDGYLSLSIYADDGFSDDAIRTGMYQNIKALVPTIFKDRPEVKKLEINILYPMTDAKGQDFDGVAMFAYFTRENNDTINWENIKLKNISIIADGFSIHPLFQEEKK